MKHFWTYAGESGTTLSSVAEQTNLSQTWSVNPKTNFLLTSLNNKLRVCTIPTP